MKPPSVRASHPSGSRSGPDPNKMKQTSLNIFMKSKPSTTATATTTFGPASSSGVSQSSPSKIPLPLSTIKPSSTFQKGGIKPSSSSTTVGGATGGRSLSTLSHALEKLVVPPPSRPNTSLGFVRSEGLGDDIHQSEDAVGMVKDKGKGKAKDDTSLPFNSAIIHQKTGLTFARPTASSLKRAATVTGSMTKASSTLSVAARGTGGPVAGGGRRTMGIFNRAGERASKKTSLPTVVGSPVKGVREMGDPGTRSESRSTLRRRSEDEDIRDGGKATLEGKPAEGVGEDAAMHDHDFGVLSEPSDNADGCRTALSPKFCKEVDIDLLTSPVSSAHNGKRPAPPSLALNPASSVLHALSESLSSLPQTLTPPKPRAVGTRTGLRSATIGKGSPASDEPGSAGQSGRGEVAAGAGSNGASGHDSGAGNKKSSLKVLKKCCIFVDVRTEQGDDAGSLFVDMLRGLGAKILSRVGQSCTHIVFKNGQPNTLTRYRLLHDPKPHIVGIAWVVECVEQRARIDEEKFKVDIELINVAGGNKRRRSMLPKHLAPLSSEGSAESPAISTSEPDEEEGRAAGCSDASPLQDPDISIRSRDEDDLPPLERARRRRSVLPGGQTRLIL
ncbi:hypothetical protein F5I97DRAFT_190578 [Phlebopus sp. FC_14]|nr:hypothetical protein F5I97DRAFT_190578 [Phlebopus sp. FC_14]